MEAPLSPDDNKETVPIMTSADEDLEFTSKGGSPNFDADEPYAKIIDNTKVRHLVSTVYVLNAKRICQKQNTDLSNG